jgi:hypothetical protein
MWLGVFIASNHFLSVGCFRCRWAYRTVWWRTGQVLFTARCVPHQHVRWGLERSTVETLCPVAASDNPVSHRTCPVRSDFAAWHLTCTMHFCSWPLSAGYRCSVGSLDMSGAHRTIWWIIAESALEKSESGQFEWSSACSVRHLQHTRKSFLQTLLSPQTYFFLGLCWTLCTWDKRHLGKLISPHGLWWTSTNKIDYRKWLSQFPFHSPCIGDSWIMAIPTSVGMVCGCGFKDVHDQLIMHAILAFEIFNEYIKEVQVEI